MLLLAAAAIAAITPPGGYGEGFYGLYRADGFSAFAKLLIYAASAVAILIAPSYFDRIGEMRAEYPVLILQFAAAGMGMMVVRDRPAHPLCRPRAAEPGRLCAGEASPDATCARRRPGPVIFRARLARLRHPALRYRAALRLLRAQASYHGIARCHAGGDYHTGLLAGIVFTLAGIAFKISSRAFRMWTPDVYEGAPTPVTAFFATAPKVAPALARCWCASRSRDRARPTRRGGRSSSSSRWHPSCWARWRRVGQTNIKRLLAYSLDQQCRLRADQPRRRHSRRALRR